PAERARRPTSIRLRASSVPPAALALMLVSYRSASRAIPACENFFPWAIAWTGKGRVRARKARHSLRVMATSLRAGDLPGSYSAEAPTGRRTPQHSPKSQRSNRGKAPERIPSSADLPLLAGRFRSCLTAGSRGGSRAVPAADGGRPIDRLHQRGIECLVGAKSLAFENRLGRLPQTLEKPARPVRQFRAVRRIELAGVVAQRLPAHAVADPAGRGTEDELLMRFEQAQIPRPVHLQRPLGGTAGFRNPHRLGGPEEGEDRAHGKALQAAGGTVQQEELGHRTVSRASD